MDASEDIEQTFLAHSLFPKPKSYYLCTVHREEHTNSLLVVIGCVKLGVFSLSLLFFSWPVPFWTGRGFLFFVYKAL